MDQIPSYSKAQMCSKHQNKTIEFLQVSNLQNTQNNHLFYCTSCINHDLSFKGIDYLLTSQIIEEGQTNIIQKWPPVNDYSILDKLIQFTNNQDSSSSIIHQINSYFTQLKEDFLKKVDLCEKKMINRALELPLGKESILNQYQQISQISQLRTLLIEGESKDKSVHELSCRKFITKIESEKEKNNELLSKLLQQCDKKEQLVDFKYPQLIKDSIFSFIDQIDFFNTSSSQNISNQSNNNNNNTTAISHSKKIMKLISNKTNFCSAEFLSKLEQQLQKINPLLSQISFENIHQRNKNPLDFSFLSEQKFSLIEDIVNHQIQSEKNQQYSETIKKTVEYQHLEKVIDSSVSFLNNNLKGQLKKYIIDSYPMLKQVNFTNATLDQNKFDCFRSLTDVEIDDLFNLTQQRKMLVNDNRYNQSQTKQINDKNHNDFIMFENVEEIFRKYPIFDLMQKKKQQPFVIKLTKTNFNDGNNRIDIHQDNQFSLKTTVSWTNCVSDIILEKEMKYIFRFQIQNYNGQYFMIGLMQNSQCNTHNGYTNKLSCYFFHENNNIQHLGGDGIDKHVKGDKLRLSQQNEIEMRVWLGGQQLEILDYPNYQYKVVIQDQYKNKLIKKNDLKLYLGLYQQGIKIMLKSAELVDVFPN